MSRFLICSLLLLQGWPLFAISEKDCQPVDLREPGLSMHGAPTFDQGSSDFCWAFAGTQLASSIVNKQNQKTFGFPPDEVALSPTISMNEATRNMDPFCPIPCEIVERTLHSKKGCSYKDVKFSDGKSKFHPDTAEVFGNSPKCGKKIAVQDAISAVEKITVEFQKKLNQEKVGWPYLATRLSAKNPSFQSTDRQEALKKFLEAKYRNGLKMADLYNATLAPSCLDLENIQSPFQGSPPLNEVLNTIDASQISCTSYRTQKYEKVIASDGGFEKGKKLKCPPIPSSQIVSNTTLLEKINGAFSSDQKLPLAIDYCYAFLFDGEPTPSSRLCQFRDGSPTSDHKSLLIGRRFNHGKCEFLLRNSWGRDCVSLHPKYRKSCEEERRKNHTADVWVSEDTIAQVTHGLSLIQEKK